MGARPFHHQPHPCAPTCSNQYTLVGRHSHTEIADRLFSLMKRLFESDSAARVRGLGCPSELLEKLEETFKDCDEAFSLEYNWANWDFENWLMKMTPIDSSLFEGNLGRISFDNVFRCGSDFSLGLSQGVLYALRPHRLMLVGTSTRESPTLTTGVSRLRTRTDSAVWGAMCNRNMDPSKWSACQAPHMEVRR